VILGIAIGLAIAALIVFVYRLGYLVAEAKHKETKDLEGG
jgi:hypothetical protein